MRRRFDHQQASPRQAGCRGENLIVTEVDTSVQSSQKYTSRKALGGIHGRGGTDLRVGIQRALDRRHRPDVIVLLTNGESPWPAEKLPVPLIMVLVGEPSRLFPVPSWAKTIVVPAGSPQRAAGPRLSNPISLRLGVRHVDDAQQVVANLRKALAESRLTQAEFAHALGTSASRLSTYLSGRTVPSAVFFLRAVRLGSAMAAARAGNWMVPMDTARAVAGELEAGLEVWALRMLMQGRDHLRSMFWHDPMAAQSWELRPGATGSGVWDRLLAAVTAHEFAAYGLEPPPWTQEAEPGPEWLLDNPFLGPAKVRDQTPPWLARLGIFISERDLATA